MTAPPSSDGARPSQERERVAGHVSGGRRFRPTRLGLVSIAEYVDETFSFAGGRLVLQGHNGAGKSKALELTVPLLFSGETRPRTLDTFGGQSKRLKDVVLWSESPKQTFVQRTGWVWLELALPGERDESTRHVTLGAGMHAHRDWQEVRTRFFVLDGPRLGHDVRLTDGHDVVSFPRLREALGDEPAVRIVDAAREFRQLQDELLFGFGDEDRYQVMVRLLLALRRPNLSENMQPETIGELLRETLPPVDTALVGRIGALLEELERISEEQREAERAGDAVRGVHEDYRQLAAAIARERAGALRDAAAELRRVVRARAAAAAEQERSSAALEATRAERLAAEQELSDLGARLRELRESPEARAARELERRAELLQRARRQVAALREGAERSAELAAGARELLDRVHGERERRLAEEQQAGLQAESDAAAAGIRGHASAVAQAGEDVRRLLAALRALASARRAQLRRQRELEAERAQAAARRQDALALRDEAAADRAARAEARAEAEREAEATLTAHLEAVVRWAEECPALVGDNEQRARLVDLASADGDDEPRGRAEAGRLAVEVIGRLDRAIAVALERAHALEPERAELTSERERLRATPDPDVPAPSWRARDPSAPGGQPLWRLIEFRPGLRDDRQRGGLEGALTASGLLDALLADDGSVWRDGDLLLAPAPLPAGGGQTLADVLQPDGGCDEAAAGRVIALLRSVALGSAAGAQVWCDLDGRFALGPAHGQHALAAPQLIGAAARERLRAHQLRSLEQRIEALTARIDSELETATARQRERDEVTAALARYPDPAALRSAVRAAQTLAREERAAAERTRRAQERLDAAQQAADRAAELAAEHRTLHEIPHDMERNEEALDDYVRSAESLASVRTAAAAARHELERARRQAELADAERQRAEREAEDSARAIDAEAAAIEEARATAGQEPAEVLARIARLAEEERAASERAATLSRQVEDMIRAEERASATLQAAIATQAESSAALEQRERGLRGLGDADLIRLVLGAGAPDDARDATAWSQDRCGELASLVLEEAPRPEAARSQLAARFDNAHVRLKEALASHRRVRIFLERTDDELPVLGARIDGAPCAFVDLAAWMENEVARLRALLDERQARLLSEHLADDVAEHLHERIHAAREWVDRTARTTARCRTSSGMGVVLRFREREDDQPGLERAIGLLGKPPSLLTEAERDELVRFLFARIDYARAIDGDEPLERLLARALDYRSWFRFDLQVRQPDGKLVAFTRRRKDLGSGGEREVLLHLPLLAAAAAVYDAAAPHAPRLIALDEAFNKVDEAGERGLLEAIVALDLDFLLCGYDLWCAHPEVPAVEIYHLKRWDDHFGIVPLHRFRWDGTRTVEVEVAA